MDVPLPRGLRRQRRLRTAVALGIGLSVLIGASVWVARLGAQLPSISKAQLWTGTAKRGSFVMRVQGAGTLRPEAVRWLTAESAGRVEAVLLKPGVQIERDTPIVRLENLDLQLQADEAERDVQAAEAQSLALEHQQAQEALRLAQEIEALRPVLADAERRASAYRASEGLIVPLHESALQQDRAAGLTRQLRLAQDKLDLLERLGPRQVAVAKEQIAQLGRVRSVRRQMLERLLVKAPIAGALQEVLVEPGQWVVPGATVAKLMVSERLEAVLRIPAEQVGAVAEGQRAEVRTGFGRAQEGLIAGHVRRVAPSAAQGTVDVEVALEGALTENARADQTIDGSIETKRIDNALTLPRPVGLPLGNAVDLYRVDPRTATAVRVRVQIGLVSTDSVEILAGLNEGDEVILSDMSRHASEPALRLE
jgi:HlyD family secretion protein